MALTKEADPPRTGRRPLPLLLIAAGLLLAGLWAGLLRLGWQLPSLLPQLPGQHGPLMATGFLGTLITLERAVALSQLHGRRRYYLAPVLAAAAGLALLFPWPPAAPRTLSLLASFGFLFIILVMYRHRPAPEHAVMGLGALLWFAGNALWLAGLPLFQVVPWWAGFLLLTIAGERLELARLVRPRRPVRQLFHLIIAGLMVALLLSLFHFDAGVRLFGLTLIALGLWLLRWDIARRTIRRAGLTRFIAACLLPGYLWLLAGGLLWLWYGGQYSAGPIWDAILHTIFLGFVFSMIFGHAPIIFPGLLGLPLSFTPLFYLHLALLHLSLVLRVAGDLLPWLPGRQWGGLLNEAAILLFLLQTLLAARRGRRARRHSCLL